MEPVLQEEVTAAPQACAMPKPQASGIRDEGASEDKPKDALKAKGLKELSEEAQREFREFMHRDKSFYSRDYNDMVRRMKEWLEYVKDK